jgi:hypothetical protein
MEGGRETAGRVAWIVTGALILVAIGMYATMLLPDGTISWLLDEDHPLEGSGSIGLLLCSILCVLLWRRERRVGGPRLRALSLLALAFVFFVAFGEEISWGQRIFGWGTPSSLKELNDQGETNLHNLDTGAVNLLFQFFWLAYGVLIPLVSLNERARRFLVKLMPIIPVPFALAFVANQVIIKAADRILTAHPSLYDGTKYTFPYGLVEIKESVVQLTFGAAFWLMYRAVRSEDRAAVAPRPETVDEPALVSA